MAFEEQLPEWQNEGTQPPQSKRVEGWLPNEKPPASWFNWLFHRAYKALQELQQKAATNEQVDIVKNDLATHKDKDVTQDDHPHGIIYERGIFTPEYTPEEGAFDEITYTDNTKGLYVRKNSEVTIYLLIQTRSIIKGAAGGGVKITGIPFVSFDPNNAASIGFYRRFATGVDRILAFADGDAIQLYKNSPSYVDAGEKLTVDDLSPGSTDNTLRLSVTYLIE